VQFYIYKIFMDSLSRLILTYNNFVMMNLSNFISGWSLSLVDNKLLEIPYKYFFARNSCFQSIKNFLPLHLIINFKIHLVCFLPVKICLDAIKNCYLEVSLIAFIKIIIVELFFWDVNDRVIGAIDLDLLLEGFHWNDWVLISYYY